jgi:hypothetical protein
MFSARDRIRSGLEAITTFDMAAFGPSQWFADENTISLHSSE